MKNIYLIILITLLFSGCGSVRPYKEPAPDQASATLTIALGDEYGSSRLSYGRADEDECFEFPPLYSTGSVRYMKKERPVPKDVRIPANGPQIVQYYREIGRNSSARACEINLQFEPKKDGRYLITSDKRYEENKSTSWLLGERTITQEICMVYVLELDEHEGVKTVPIKQIDVKPTSLGLSGCRRVAKK